MKTRSLLSLGLKFHGFVCFNNYSFWRIRLCFKLENGLPDPSKEQGFADLPKNKSASLLGGGKNIPREEARQGGSDQTILSIAITT